MQERDSQPGCDAQCFDLREEPWVRVASWRQFWEGSLQLALLAFSEISSAKGISIDHY